MMPRQYSTTQDSASTVLKSPTSTWTISWWHFAALMLTYKLLLDISYEFIAFAYQYQALFYNGRTLSTEILSWLCLIFSLPAMKILFNDRSASGNILFLLVIFSYIPTISVISFRSDYDTTYIVLMIIFWLLFYFWWIIMKPIHFRALSRMESRSFYIICAIALSASVLIYSYMNIGFRFHFNIIDVYEIRAEAREFIAPFPLNYLVSFADNILALLAVFFFMRGMKLTSIAILFVIFVNFSISGTKQILFLPFLGFIGYFVFKDYINSYKIIIAGILFLLASILENIVYYSSILHGIFSYRILFIPAELHYMYYDYFQSHDLLFYSQSILKPFSIAPQENIQFVIGEQAVGTFTARANNGLFSDAYMNAGIFGVLIYPLILAAYLRVLDGAIVRLPGRIRFVVVLYVAFVLLGMTLTAALFTSGLLFLIFLLYSLPRKAATPAAQDLERLSPVGVAGPAQ